MNFFITRFASVFYGWWGHLLYSRHLGVDHEILSTKIKRYGVHSTPLRWISSDLSKGEHFILESDPISIIKFKYIGVLHGSILGPLLFLIYIDDIVNSSDVLSFVLFADDTTVHVQNDSVDSAIEMAKVALWFDSNKLPLNVNKTHMIMLSRENNLIPQNQVILQNNLVQRVNKAKF